MILICVPSLFIIFLSSTSSSLHPSYGNELAQLNRYISLVDAQSSFNVSEVYEAYRSCEQSVSPEKGFRFYTCRGDIRKQQMAIRSPLYKPGRRPASKKYVTDCKYRVVNSNDSSYSFQISQEECKSKFSLSQGGATFEVSAVSTDYLALCRVIDTFDDKYKVYCDFPIRAIEKECPHVTIFLHFEHFDAFSDLGDDNFAPMNRSIHSGEICFSTLKTSNSTVELVGDSTEDYYWIRNNITFIPLKKLENLNDSRIRNIETDSSNRSSHAYYISGTSSIQYHDSADYAWSGEKGKYLTISAMQECLKKQDIYLIGESHMRYQFDLIMTRYIDRTQVGRYHGSMNHSGLSFQDCTFTNRLILTLQKISCDFPKKVTTYVLQGGSWDLQFFPPRGFINSPYQANAVLNAIEELRNRLKEGDCEGNVRIVWMSTMPHPWCAPHDLHCLRLANYYRNNGAINAINQYMEEKLLLINMKHLLYVDTGAILLPRFHLKEFLCVDHFICNSPPAGLFTTPGGTALMNYILINICDEYKNKNVNNRKNNQNITMNEIKKLNYYLGNESLDNVSYYNNKIIGDKNQINDNSHYIDSTQISNNLKADKKIIFEIHQNFSYFTNVQKLYESENNFFTVEDGCRRKIPDLETVNYMGFNVNNFQNVSKYVLDDIPPCYHLQYPSRRTYTLLQSYNSRTVYFMDNGERRPLEGLSSMISLKLDFENVQLIPENDLYSILEGKIIKTKTDCNSCSL